MGLLTYNSPQSYTSDAAALPWNYPGKRSEEDLRRNRCSASAEPGSRVSREHYRRSARRASAEGTCERSVRRPRGSERRPAGWLLPAEGSDRVDAQAGVKKAIDGGGAMLRSSAQECVRCRVRRAGGRGLHLYRHLDRRQRQAPGDQEEDQKYRRPLHRVSCTQVARCRRATLSCCRVRHRTPSNALSPMITTIFCPPKTRLFR